MNHPDSKKRLTLQRLSALSVAPLLPLGAGSAHASTASSIHALPRLALVIGNSRYAESPLKNPANDAKAIAADLKQLGFAVDLQMDAKKAAMEQAILSFCGSLAKQKAVGLFYFAGHGLQLSWRNFLVPVDAVLDRADDVPSRTVNMSTLLDGLTRAGNPMNIVILDACRDNPFGTDLKSGKGLSQMDAPIGTLLAYATAPGNVASDGSGSNGLYTENLLREMRAPEAKIEDIFKRVRLGVRRASHGVQIPWESTSLEDDFYFLPPAHIKKLSQEELDRQFAEEAAVWEKAKDAAEPAPIESYLKSYPSGRFAELAQMRLDRILAKKGEKKIRIVSAAANPFSRGTAVTDLDYRVGDRFVYRTIDLLTKIEAANKGKLTVTEINDNEVIYNKGAYISDLLGNTIKWWDGTRYGPSQFYAGEYSLGRKWATRYPVTYTNGHKDAIEYDFKVVGKETITVPAGTFDCFRVEGTGWVMGIGLSLQVKYWVAPDKVRRVIALEQLNRNRWSRITTSNRYELVSFSQAAR
jgi:hypothetical protein